MFRRFVSHVVHRSKDVTLIQYKHQYHPYRKLALRVGIVLAFGTAGHQFLSNLHTVPISGRTQVVVMSREDELEIGKSEFDQELQSVKLIESGPAVDRVLAVAKRLSLVTEHLFQVNFDWEYALVESNDINACCYPGGKIIVNSGMLDFIDQAVEKGHCKSRYDTLAVVLAHEIAHAIARHVAERLSLLPLEYLLALLHNTSPLLAPLWSYGISLPYSRKHEEEADHLGLILMASACYDSDEAEKLWLAFQEESPDSRLSEFFSTHPAHERRSEALHRRVEEARAARVDATWCKELQQAVQRIKRGSLLRRRSTTHAQHEDELEKLHQSLTKLKDAEN